MKTSHSRSQQSHSPHAPALHSTTQRAVGGAARATRSRRIVAAIGACSLSFTLASCHNDDAPTAHNTAATQGAESGQPAGTDAALAANPTAGNRHEGSQGNGDGDACGFEDLKFGVVNEQGGAGSKFFDIRFTNTSDHTCSMTGYPGVSMVTDNNGTQLGTSAKREDIPNAAMVTLRPGDSALAQVRVRNAHAMDSSQCQPTAADGIRIYPPDDTSAGYVALPDLTGCAGKGDVLTVQPVIPEK